MTRENQGMVLGFIGVAAFALTLPATRHLVQYLDPLFIGVGRAFFAGLLAMLILLLARQRIPSLRQLSLLALVCAGVVVGFPVLSAIAMQTLPASHGGVILAILPLATVVAGVFVSSERPSFGFWLMSVLGTVLVLTYSILRNSSSGSAFQLAFGDLLLILAVISAAGGYAIGGRLAQQMGGWQVICWACTLGLPILAYPALMGVSLYSNEPSSTLLDDGGRLLHSIPTSALLSFVYLSVISQLVGFFFWYRGLALGGIARVSQLQLLQPFITIAAAAILLNETVDALTLWFALAVVLVVAVGKRMSVNQKSS